MRSDDIKRGCVFGFHCVFFAVDVKRNFARICRCGSIYYSYGDMVPFVIVYLSVALDETITSSILTLHPIVSVSA